MYRIKRPCKFCGTKVKIRFKVKDRLGKQVKICAKCHYHYKYDRYEKKENIFI